MHHSKIVFFNRSAVHYRERIYCLMDKELDIDFYFGDSRPGEIKSFDYTGLKGFKKLLKNIIIREPIYWQIGVISLAFKPYKVYITPGDIWSISTWITLVLCRMFGKKVILWTHGWYGKETWLKRIIKKIHFLLANEILLYGGYAKRMMINQGINPNKIHIIYNSLDYDKQLSIRKTKLNENIFVQHFNNENKNLIFIGRLTKIKCLEISLLALFLLKQKGVTYNITFIGDGEMKTDLSVLAQEMHMTDNVWFYGECYDEHLLAKLLFNADLCVSPGNVGLTAIHSMSYGTPVITHNNFAYQMPEFEAIIEGETGAFFTQNNIESLSVTIAKWFSLSIERQQIRKQCYEVIDTKYNPYIQISIIKKIINKYN